MRSLAALVLAAAACSGGAPCVSDSDCGAADYCLDGRCLPRPVPLDLTSADSVCPVDPADLTEPAPDLAADLTSLQAPDLAQPPEPADLATTPPDLLVLDLMSAPEPDLSRQDLVVPPDLACLPVNASCRSGVTAACCAPFGCHNTYVSGVGDTLRCCSRSSNGGEPCQTTDDCCKTLNVVVTCAGGRCRAL